MFFVMIFFIAGSSFIFFNLREKDERINDLLHRKLSQEYIAKEIDESEIHPAAQ